MGGGTAASTLESLSSCSPSHPHENFATYLLDRVKVAFHALNSYVLASLDGLGLEYFRKGALALLRNQAVLYRRDS